MIGASEMDKLTVDEVIEALSGKRVWDFYDKRDVYPTTRTLLELFIKERNASPNDERTVQELVEGERKPKGGE